MLTTIDEKSVILSIHAYFSNEKKSLQLNRIRDNGNTQSAKITKQISNEIFDKIIDKIAK